MGLPCLTSRQTQEKKKKLFNEQLDSFCVKCLDPWQKMLPEIKLLQNCDHENLVTGIKNLLKINCYQNAESVVSLCIF